MSHPARTTVTPSDDPVSAAREWMASSRDPSMLHALVNDPWFIETQAAHYNHESALVGWFEDFWQAGQEADFGGTWRGRLLWNARGAMADFPRLCARLFEITHEWSNMPQPLETYASINRAFPPLMSLGDAAANRTFLAFVVRDALYPHVVLPLSEQGWVTGDALPIAAHVLAHGSVATFEHIIDGMGQCRRPEDLTLAHVREVASALQLKRYHVRDDGSRSIHDALDYWSKTLRAEDERRQLDTVLPSAPARARARL